MKNIIFFAVISFLFASCAASDENKIDERVNKIHDDIISLDSHTDTPLRLVRDKSFDLAEYHENYGKIDLPRMKEGRLDAVFFGVFLGQGKRDKEGKMKAKERALNIISVIDSSLNANKKLTAKALSASDAEKIKKENKAAVYLGMENGYPVGTDLLNVKEFYDLGVRYITLCHSENNDICDSSTDPDGPEFNGLSKFGEEVVKEMNKLGMMVDISHVSDSTFYDVLKISKVPVIASHSNARELRDHPRNISDDMLKALAHNDGVIQVCLLTDYIIKTEPNPELEKALDSLRNEYSEYPNLSEERRKKMYAEWEEVNNRYDKKLATVKDLVDHIDHVVKVAGIDHVGIGSDFDGGGELKDCYDISGMKNITKELISRGYSDDEIEKIWGGNFLRVFEEVERGAEKI